MKFYSIFLLLLPVVVVVTVIATSYSSSSLFFVSAVSASSSSGGEYEPKSAPSSASQKKFEYKPPLEVDSSSYDQIPDPDDDQVREQLECSACSLAISYLQQKLEKIKREFSRQPEKLKTYHVLAVTEEVCSNKNQQYFGLFVDSDGKVQKKFVHESAVDNSKNEQILRGSWVQVLWRRACHDMIEIAEDNIDAVMKGRQVQLCPSQCRKYNDEEKKSKKQKRPGGPKKNNKKKGGGGIKIKPSSDLPNWATEGDDF